MNQEKCAGTGDGQALESPARLLAWFSWDVEMDEGRAQCCCAEPPEGAGLDPKVPEPGACSVPTLPGLSPGLGPQHSGGIHLQPAPSMAPALCHHSTLAVTLVSAEPEVATVYPLLASGSSLATEDALLATALPVSHQEKALGPCKPHFIAGTNHTVPVPHPRGWLTVHTTGFSGGTPQQTPETTPGL